MMTRWRQPLAVACVALFVASCGSTPSPSQAPASGAPSSSAESLGPGEPTPPADATSVQQGLLLSEVLFAPSPGESAFIEIANTGSGPIDTAGALLHIGSADLSLGGLPAALAPGAQLLVSLDGGGTVKAPVIHAAVDIALDPTSDTVTLVDRAGLTLDRVAWGPDQPDAVPTGSGGVVPDAFAPGTSIGRAPGATQPGQGSDWVVNAAADVTPGAPNPMPSASVLLPLSGAVLDGSVSMLAWYPVPGAASYHVQIAAEFSFAAPVFDQTTAEPQIEGGTLAAGLYFWRVQALALDGTASRFSPANAFELASGGVAAVQAVLALAGTGPLAPTGSLALFADDPGKQLPVPLLSQHKDTAMLLLERNVEKGAHAWDVDHGKLDPKDPADNKNCAIATIAMMNHFYGGNLSQDRIGYEVRKNLVPTGPEWDLNYGTGITVAAATEAFEFALGPGIDTYQYGSYEAMWDRIVTEIKAGRPIAAANSHHGFVITGYAIVGGRRLITVNDPWQGSYVTNIDRAVLPASAFTFWRMPTDHVPTGRTQESGVKDDADKDGVVDFDETERFHTDPDNKDTDGDKLPDKQDIITGVFDPKHGYAKKPTPLNDGRDYDFDGIPTELDPDSDRGGCQDGQEDKNLDGHRTPPETSNFDTQDDGASCGGWRGTITTTWSETGGLGHLEGTLSATVLFEPDPTAPEYFIATDGSATWSENGADVNCTTEGAGTYSLVTPGDDAKSLGSRAAQLRIWDGGDPGALRYSGLGNAPTAIETPTTLTCDGQVSTISATRAKLWLTIVTTLPRAPDGSGFAGESGTFPKDARSFSGTFTDTIQGGAETQTWTWTFEKVGD